jgi:hypothetical protein
LSLTQGFRVMTRLFVFLIFFALLDCSVSAQRVPFSHTAFDRVLQQFVDDRGLVNYSALKAEPADLKTYLKQLAQFSPEATPERFPTHDDSLAYWLNAYNAFAIAGVIDAYPVKSVRDIKWFYGFFNRIDHLAGGVKYTLKHIEHQIVRKGFDDPRIHVGLNCASLGCPKLSQKAFHAATLQSDLEEAMRVFLNETRNVLVNREENHLYLSAIHKEFEGDFTGWLERYHAVQKATIIDYLKRYVHSDDVEFLDHNLDLRILYVKYDWRLNDQALHNKERAME